MRTTRCRVCRNLIYVYWCWDLGKERYNWFSVNKGYIKTLLVRLFEADLVARNAYPVSYMRYPVFVRLLFCWRKGYLVSSMGYHVFQVFPEWVTMFSRQKYRPSFQETRYSIWETRYSIQGTGHSLGNRVIHFRVLTGYPFRETDNENFGLKFKNLKTWWVL